MNIKKISGLIGAVLAVASLTSAAMGYLAWRSFWIFIILLAGFTYLVFPHLPEE